MYWFTKLSDLFILTNKCGRWPHCAGQRRRRRQRRSS